jgi:hypothetical protein
MLGNVHWGVRLLFGFPVLCLNTIVTQVLVFLAVPAEPAQVVATTKK